MMTWDYMLMNGWLGAWMWIPLVLIVALLTGTIAVVRSLGIAPRVAEDPLMIAARRFARSEITKDEYEAVRATLARP